MNYSKINRLNDEQDCDANKTLFVELQKEMLLLRLTRDQCKKKNHFYPLLYISCGVKQKKKQLTPTRKK